MRIFWSNQARLHLSSAYEYIACDNLTAAEGQLEAILTSVENLVNFPEMGRPGRISGNRELVVPDTPYLVAYRLREGSIRILAVLHGARRWPSRL